MLERGNIRYDEAEEKIHFRGKSVVLLEFLNIEGLEVFQKFIDIIRINLHRSNEINANKEENNETGK